MMPSFFKHTLLNGLMLLGSLAAVYGQPLTYTIDLRRKAQTIDNFGASGAWFTENIGKYWAAEKKERMAELLFSKAFDPAGKPLGIGLSAWRFNIGGGTAEQGDSSGIRPVEKRVESFLAPDGTYDWSKQQGYLWFVRKAAAYQVENLIAFSNTPPVQFTKNGLGFRLQKDYETNLRDDHYGDYAGFLATVLQHFDAEGLHFTYISPVNEPQWDWSNKFGEMNQEGSPWHNRHIYRIAACLDSALTARKLSSKILIPEAAILTALYEGNGHASRQIRQFYTPGSPYYVGALPHIQPVMAGHSYFTDAGDTTILRVRQRVRDTAARYRVPFWQSEYSMLADGYKEGRQGRIAAMDCALFLSKMIWADLTIADAAAWQLWNAWEPGRADVDTRYYLLALKQAPDKKQGDFTITKNLWALGHYSRFVRPGMQRIITERSDQLPALQTLQDIMLAAFTKGKETVVVAINYTDTERTIELKLPQVKKIRVQKQYTTTADAADNMTPYPLPSLKAIRLKPHSINTIILQHG